VLKTGDVSQKDAVIAHKAYDVESELSTKCQSKFDIGRIFAVILKVHFVKNQNSVKFFVCILLNIIFSCNAEIR